MKKFRIKLLKNGGFWMFFTIISFIVTCSCHASFVQIKDALVDKAKTQVEKDIAKYKKEKTPKKGFLISAFNNIFILRCEDNEKSNTCSPNLKKIIKHVLDKMKNTGVYPLSGLFVELKFFGQCTNKLEKASGCLPYFQLSNERDVYYAKSVIVLPDYVLASNQLRHILVHELFHGFVSTVKVRDSRLIGELLSVYMEVVLFDDMYNKECISDFANTSALSTPNGEYPSAIKSDKFFLRKIHKCRYSQLEKMLRSVHAKFPLLFLRLWHRLIIDGSNKINISSFLSIVKSLNYDAWRLMKTFSIMQPGTGHYELAALDFDKKLFFFFYKVKSASEHSVSRDVKITILHFRNKKLIDVYRHNPIKFERHIIINRNKLKSNDVLFVLARGEGIEVNKFIEVH